MQEKLRSYFSSTLEKWNNLDKSQKIRLILTVVIVVGLLVATVIVTTRPRLVVLKNNLDAKVAGQIKAALDDEGILNRITNAGSTVMVDEKEKDNAQVLLSMKNIPNDNTFTYADAMANSGMSATESVKKENFRRLRQSDLVNQIKLIDGVENADIQLVIPDTDAFYNSSAQKASVAVVLNLSKGLDKAQATTIARILSRGVPNLDLDSIEITDQNGNLLYGGDQATAGNTATTNYDIELQRKREISAIIKSTFSPLFNEVKVVPNLRFNWDESQQVREAFSSPLGADSATGLISEDTNSSQSVVNAPTQQAAPGVDANNAQAPNYPGGAGTESTADVSDRATKYIYDRLEEVTKASIGNLIQAQSSISVVFYRNREYDEASMTKNNQLNGQSWADFKNATASTITPIDIDPGILSAIQTGTGIDTVTVSAYEVPVFIDAVVEPVNVPQIIMFVILAILILMLAYALIKKTQPEEIAEVEPELSIDDILIGPQIEEERTKEIESVTSEEKLKEIAYGPDSEIMKQIEKFINEKPEAAAALLRNWLNDDWDS